MPGVSRTALAPCARPLTLTLGLALALAVTLAVSACSTPPPAAAAAGPVIDPAKVVDLSYAYGAETIYWPNAEGFRHRKDTWAITPGGYWYAAGDFGSAEHGGTHMDAPVHFAQGKATVDQIPVEQLIGPVVVVDITAQAARAPDYRASAQDVQDFERAHGAIAAGTFVVFRTGWGRFWPDRKQYMGSDVPGDTAHLHFPGVSREAAELLVQRRIRAVGIDTASMDYGPSTDFIVHQVLNGAGIYGVENVANAERLPATGATLIALPMKIEEGTGAPTRVIAILP